MKKVWLIALNTYKQGVRSSTFIMITLGLPLLMLISGGFAAWQAGGRSLPTIGYVDLTGKVPSPGDIRIDDEILRLKAFPDLASAQSAQSEKIIDAYLVVPEGYFLGEAVRYYGKDDPRGKIQSALRLFMRRSLLPDASQNTLDLVAAPLGNLTLVASESGITIRDGFSVAIRVMFPFVLVGLFGFLITTNISQMGAAMVREKDQRAMEIVLTSLSVTQLVAGKITGVTLVSLTQIAVWIVGGVLALLLVMSRWGSGEPVVVPFDIIAWALAFFLPAYFLYVTLAAGLGIVAGNSRQAQQVAGILSMVGMSPFFVITPLLDSPNGPLAVGLSLFPLTAPMIAILRMSLTTVPTWQLLLSIGLIVIALLGSIWLVTRVFRAAMLLYGQPLRPYAMLRALRGGHQPRAGGESR